MKQKIWIVSWYGMQSGGLERIVRIINQILREKYDVTIVDIPFVCQYKHWKSFLKVGNRVSMMIVFSAFVKMNAKRGDIVITHGQNAPFVKSDFLFDHGSILSLKREMGQFVYGGSSVFELIAVKKARLNIAVSQWTKEQIINNYHIKDKKVAVLNNCVETDLFYPIPKMKKSKITVLFCGRLEEAKGLKLLLQLADEIENRSEYNLRIAANDDCNMDLFKDRTNIEIECGIQVENMNDFYNAGDILFVPSRCEGFGMGIIESLAAGIPVMTNEVGIVTDLLKEKCPAIEIVKKEKSIKELLEEMGRMARRYSDFEERERIHHFIQKKFGLQQYAEKLNGLIGGNSHA